MALSTRTPQMDKEYHYKPISELTEQEKYERELRKTQLVKAAPATKTSSAFEDPLVSKFTNVMMKGNKVLACFLMTQTLEALKRKQFEKYHAAAAGEQAALECNPYTIFHQALKNDESMIGLEPILKSGHFYQVPVPLAEQPQWMITECREKQHQWTLMPGKLSNELLQAFYSQGPVMNRKHDVHRMAEANQALAHYCCW